MLTKVADFLPCRFSFLTAGHFMQRGDFGKGPHFEICRRDEMEIQGQSAVCVFVLVVQVEK